MPDSHILKEQQLDLEMHPNVQSYELQTHHSTRTIRRSSWTKRSGLLTKK